MLKIILSSLAMAIAASVSVQAQQAAVAAPVFEHKPMQLVDLPAPAGAATALFNGKDLNDWEAWLGYRDPALTYQGPPEAPIGPAGLGDIYKVVTVDGAPAILISGVTWGGLTHKGDFANYHLRLEYKWGDKTYAPRLTSPQNNGLLYHSFGAPGAVYGTWMAAAEFEIMKGSVGMLVPVGRHVRARTMVGHDPAIIQPHLRFMPGGLEIEVTQPAWNVEASVDAEKPVGEWNTLDLYVLGDEAVHVVNGVPVLHVTGLSTVDSAGGRTPLTHGRIQLQSEGAETYFRNITLQSITTLPRLISK